MAWSRESSGAAFGTEHTPHQVNGFRKSLLISSEKNRLTAYPWSDVTTSRRPWRSLSMNCQNSGEEIWCLICEATIVRAIVLRSMGDG